MNAARLLVQSARAMARYKLRTGFMMLGSLVGVAALTFAVSLGQNAQVKMMRTVRQIIGDGSVVVIGRGSRITGSPRGGAARLTLDDAGAVANEVAAIVDWDPQAELSGAAVRRGDAAASVRVIGQSERWQRVWGRATSRGESFDAAAVAGSARVALVGETVARALFAGEDPVGAEIQVNGVALRVIGVLEPFGVDMHGMDRDNEIVVPISTLMRRLTNADAISAVRFQLGDASRTPEATRAIKNVLRRRHALGRDQSDDFMIVSALQAQKMVAMIRRVLLLYVPLVAAVVLLVGGIVAASLMLASVNERVGEIGLRRAVGALPGDIRRQFLVETAATLVAGGIGGIALGYVAVRLVSARMHLGDTFSWTAVLISIAASALTGWLAGVAPARRAARLQPAEALR